MISGLLLILLSWQFFIGYRRGLPKQIYEVITLVTAFIIASSSYRSLADKLTLWVPYAQPTEELILPHFSAVNVFEMDSVFYAGLAFSALLGLVYGGFKLLAFLTDLFSFDHLDTFTYRLVAGGLSVLVTVVFWSVAFKLLATIPFAQVQGFLDKSFLIKAILNLPVVSQLLYYFWVVRILG